MLPNGGCRSRSASYSNAAIVAALILVVSGCFLYQKPAPNTNYGTYPDNYKELVEDYVETRPYFQDLKLWFSSGPPRKAYQNRGLIPFGGGIDFTGYAVQFNTYEESMRTAWFALIRDGKVIEVTTNSHDHMKFVQE